MKSERLYDKFVQKYKFVSDFKSYSMIDVLQNILQKEVTDGF